MSNKNEYSSDEYDGDDEVRARRNTYRVRRATASRRRAVKKPSMPGGIRQRRNKHWNW